MAIIQVNRYIGMFKKNAKWYLAKKCMFPSPDYAIILSEVKKIAK